MAKKYAGIETLRAFLVNLRNTFSELGHKHTLSEITDYEVDSQLSATSTHPVQNKVLEAEFDAISKAMGVLEQAIDEKAGSTHNHDDKYYTETEIDTKLASKADTSHNHDSLYDAKDSAKNALIEAKSYAETVSNTAANAVKDALLNGAGEAYDTLSELATLIDENHDAIDALVTVANGKANVEHAHTISEVDELQTTLDAMNEELRNNTWYGTCPTAASTTEKVVTTASGDFELKTGSIVYVLFTYTSCANATLNVDGKGAKAIKIVGNNNVSTYHWGLNEVVGFAYDGTYFRMLDGQVATTTYYGVTKLSSSTSSTSTTAAATPSAVKAAYDLADSAYTLAEDSGIQRVNMSSEDGAIWTATIDGIEELVNGKAFLFIPNRTSSSTTPTLNVNGLGAVTVRRKMSSGTATLCAPNTSTLFFANRPTLLMYDTANDTPYWIALEFTKPSATDLYGKVPVQNGGWFSNSNTIEEDLIEAREAFGVYSKEDQTWSQIYDSGDTTAQVNSFANINIAGYKKLIVAIRCVNDTTNASTTRYGSAIFKATNGTTYQFPVFNSMFSASSNTSATMGFFDIIDGWIICPQAIRSVRCPDFLSDVEGGTCTNLNGMGGGAMKCTNTLSQLTVSSLDQDSTFFFGVGSRVVVWGCKA